MLEPSLFIGMVLFGLTEGAQADNTNAKLTDINSITFFIVVPLESWNSH